MLAITVRQKKKEEIDRFTARGDRVSRHWHLTVSDTQVNGTASTAQDRARSDWLWVTGCNQDATGSSAFQNPARPRLTLALLSWADM